MADKKELPKGSVAPAEAAEDTAALKKQVAELERKLAAAESALSSIEQGDLAGADLVTVPIYLKTKLPRKDLAHLKPGAVLARIYLEPKVDVNLVVDCIRHGHAGEEAPKRPS